MRRRQSPLLSSSSRVGLPLVVALLVWSRPARAYRPFDSTDAAVAEEGEIEVELGPVGYEAVGTERWLVAPAVVLNLGVLPDIELVLEGRGLIGSAANMGAVRLTDTALSLKGILRRGALQGGSGPSIATELQALLPTVNDEPGVGAGATLIVSQQWAALTIHLNGRVSWERSQQPGLFGGAILEGPAGWAVRPVAELLAEKVGTTLTVAGLLGAIWPLRESLSFDGALRIGRQQAIQTVEVRIGLTWDMRVFGAPPATEGLH